MLVCTLDDIITIIDDISCTPDVILLSMMLLNLYYILLMMSLYVDDIILYIVNDVIKCR